MVVTCWMSSTYPSILYMSPYLIITITQWDRLLLIPQFSEWEICPKKHSKERSQDQNECYLARLPTLPHCTFLVQCRKSLWPSNFDHLIFAWHIEWKPPAPLPANPNCYSIFVSSCTAGPERCWNASSVA